MNANKETPADQGKTPEKRTLPRGQYITEKMKQEPDAKRKIAAKAVSYVKDFDAVLLDAGSTVELVAEEMFKQRKFLSVLTNNMGVYAAYLEAVKGVENGNKSQTLPNQGNELLITGGRYVDVYESLLGDGALSSIKEFTPNVVIMGTSGLRCEGGIFCHGSEETAVKTLLWTKPTDTRLIVTDWTKIGKRDASAFGDITDLMRYAEKAVIVTNSPPKEFYDSNTDLVKTFDNELKKIESYGIIVDKI